MQTLKIDELDCLVMYDSGANTNMIEGRVAEFLDLPIVDQSPTTIAGIVDTKVRTDFGTYKICLGPDQEGCYHDIVAHGASRLAAKMPEYPLEKINDEV